MMRMSLAVCLVSSFLLACSKDGSGESPESPGTAGESQAPSGEKSGNEAPPPPRRSQDPSLPLDQRVTDSIAEANTTYQKLTGLRTLLFQDTIEQARAIVCSAYRIIRLKAEHDPTQYRFSIDTGREIQRVLGSLLSGQEMIAVNTACYDPRTEWDCRSSCKQYQVHHGYCGYSLSAVRSSAYGAMSLEVALGQMGTCSNVVQLADSASYATEHTPPCEDVKWTCETHYMKPVPNSDRARAIEVATFSKIIATSIRRLLMYQERLPVLEEQISTVSSFEATLIKLKKDLQYDMADTLSAEKNIRESDSFYNHALESLSEWKKQLAVDVEIPQSEINAISEVFDAKGEK